MGCCASIKELDSDLIRSPVVLEAKNKTCRYHGTTEQGRVQTLGNAHVVLTEDGIYSQVLGTTCCGDRGYLHMPLASIRGIREQDWFNGRYRLDRPHLVITYRVSDKDESQAGWQMDHTSVEQWKAAIERLVESKFMIELK